MPSSIEPALEHSRFAQTLGELGATPGLCSRIIRCIDTLNRRVRQDPELGAGFCIGHSYFCQVPEGSEADVGWYERIIRSEVGPLLREYWFDSRERADEEIARLLVGEQ